MNDNPFDTTGKIVGVDYNPGAYHEMQGGKRGEEDFIVSRSELMDFAHCPQRWLRGVEDPGSASTEFGGLLDTIVTAPKSVKKLYAVRPRQYMDKKGELKPWNGNSDTCRKWKADQEQAGRIVVKDEVMLTALQAEARLKEDNRIAHLLKHSRKQVCVTGLFKHAPTKLVIAVKALIDLVPDWKGTHGDCLADLKTAQSAAVRDWQRAVFHQGYHIQAAMYLDLFNSVPTTAKPRTRFLHVIVESSRPFEPARRMLSEEFIAIGRAAYLGALNRYCDCLKRKEFPGFDDEGADIVNGWRLVEPESYMVDF